MNTTIEQIRDLEKELELDTVPNLDSVSESIRLHYLSQLKKRIQNRCLAFIGSQDKSSLTKYQEIMKSINKEFAAGREIKLVEIHPEYLLKMWEFGRPVIFYDTLDIHGIQMEVTKEAKGFNIVNRKKFSMNFLSENSKHFPFPLVHQILSECVSKNDIDFKKGKGNDNAK